MSILNGDRLVCRAPAPELPEIEQKESEATIKLRAQLRKERLRALEERAESDGAKLSDIDAAMDSESPKTALIELIVKLQGTEQGPSFAQICKMDTGAQGSLVLTHRPAACRPLAVRPLR